MADQPIEAFLSRRFVEDRVVDAICKVLGPEIRCKPATELFLRPIPSEILKRIKKADLLVAIITTSGNSSWIQNEMGMAYALEKPVLVFCEDGVLTDGFAPMVSEYVKFKREDLSSLVNEKERLVKGISQEVLENRERDRDLFRFTKQRNLGVVGVYPDRKQAFTGFRDEWDREEQTIDIVSSTFEGFRKFVGEPGHELIAMKLESGCRIRLLCTHPDYLSFRAEYENVTEQSIEHQLHETISQLQALDAQAKGTLEIRLFRAPPTCFLIKTSSFMLLNPYPYMLTAYSSFAVLVRKTGQREGIFEIYSDYHFERAWARSERIDEQLGAELGACSRRKGPRG
jgi:nucleoside 2-deoxyribosyltransferase